MLALDRELEFDAAREEEFFSALPARPAVFLLEAREANAEPYLRRTADLRRRLERLLRVPQAPSKRLNLREYVARVRYRVTGSPLEQNFVFYQHARELFPGSYGDLARLRPPALLKINLATAYPRCYVTRRIAGAASYFGPFASRKAAEAFANEFLNLFKIRRCQIKILRDPAFPGCIYSEMKMCLAPCFAGCTKEEYDVEVSRVVNFLGSSGATLTMELAREREAASEALDFERAAALHRRVDKVAEVLRGLPELARQVDELDAVIVQPAAEENSVAIFAVRGGWMADPFLLRFAELASQPRSVEEILREQLGATFSDDTDRAEADVVAGPAPPGARRPAPLENRARQAAPLQGAGAREGHELTDHLGLLARWFYGKPRQGEVFFPRRSARGSEWPYRRIIRACSRLLAPQPSLPFPPGQEHSAGSA